MIWDDAAQTSFGDWQGLIVGDSLNDLKWNRDRLKCMGTLLSRLISQGIEHDSTTCSFEQCLAR